VPMEANPARDGIQLQSRTLSHYLVTRKVAELVGAMERLHSFRREWLVELPSFRLPATWRTLLAALRTAEAATPWDVVLLEDRSDEVNAVAVRGAGLQREVLRLQVAARAVTAWLYGATADCGAAADVLCRALTGVARSDEPGSVPVRFWHQGSDGTAVDSLRRIHCPRFAEIADNYPGVRGSLERLVVLALPWEHGRLIFWHGPPGTGKTWALRALIREWSALSPEVITDPEPFFASNAYLQQVLLADPPSQPSSEGRYVTEEERPRLFILEDAPQLVLQESRGALGSRIGNLLSMTDGILGQGLRAIFLITTNEKVSRVDPAIRRPGRCLQELELPGFSAEQARSWLEARGLSEVARLQVEGDRSLAELYELFHRGTHTPRPVETRMGFSARER